MSKGHSQTIFRVASRHKPYSQLGNSMLRDKRLSIEARGALAFILSHPADWRFSLEWMARELGIGRGKAQRIVRELVDNGYCNRQQHRNDRGRLAYIEYAFSDEVGEVSPQDENRPTDTQHLVSPRDGLPPADNPRAVNPLPTKKVSPKETEIQKEDVREVDLASPRTDEWTRTFSKAVVDELTALGVDVGALIERYDKRTQSKRIMDPSAYLLRMGLDEVAKRCGVTVEQVAASNSKNVGTRMAAAASLAPPIRKPSDDIFRQANERLRQRMRPLQ